MAKRLGTIKGKEVLGFDLQGCECKSVADDELVMIGSTADQDRDQEVIKPEAWDLKNYKKNPVILPAHDYRQPAIAKATAVKVKDGKLEFKIKFPPEGVNPVADVYRKLYKGGFMNASSVGFIPVKWETGDGVKNPYRTYTDVELLELSLVSVPANPSALTEQNGIKEAVSKGVLTGKDIKTLQEYAKVALKGGEENVNDNAELPIVDPTADADQQEQIDQPATKAEDKSFVEEIKGTLKIYETKLAETEKAIGELKEIVKELQENLSALEIKLVEAFPEHYLDLADEPAKGPARPIDGGDIKDLARDAFK